MGRGVEEVSGGYGLFLPSPRVQVSKMNGDKGEIETSVVSKVRGGPNFGTRRSQWS